MSSCSSSQRHGHTFKKKKKRLSDYKLFGFFFGDPKKVCRLPFYGPMESYSITSLVTMAKLMLKH